VNLVARTTNSQLPADCLRRSPPPFPLNGGNTDLVKLLPKRLDSFGSTATVFQFESCQWRRLAENLDLEIDEFADFSLDVIGWGCHRAGLLE
jgi:hypothetical protein